MELLPTVTQCRRRFARPDLASGRLLRPTPVFFALNASDVAFDPQAAPPRRWVGFLSELFGNDQQALETLQEWFGYCLSTDTSQQKIMPMVGPPRSGKGTIAHMVHSSIRWTPRHRGATIGSSGEQRKSQ